MARTKGSKNGISRTKGYTAVGQRAKGRWVNGRYVYDLPKFSSGNTEMIRDGKVVYENPSTPAGVASYPKKKSDWAKEAASYDNHVTTYPKQGYDALMTEKRNAWLAGKAQSQGAKNNWQQTANKAAAAGVRNAMVTTNAANAKKKAYQDTLAKGAAMGDAAKAADAQRKAEAKARWQAGNKAMAAKKAKEQGEKNNWQQRANETASNRMLYSKWREGSVNATNSHAYMTPNGDYNPWVADAAKGSSKYMKRKMAANNASEKGVQNNWQQHAALEQWKKQNQNAIATNKKFQKAYQDTLAKGAAMGDAAKALDAQRKAEAKARLQAGNKAAKMPNAMQGDPRYSTGYREVKNKEGKVIGTYSHSVLNSTPNGRDKYDYSGKSDSRAPTFKGFEGTFKMNRDPYFNSWANATNVQEEAKAISKNKEFMNDFRTSKIRNSRSDIGNALADAKEEAKAKWKSLKKSIKKRRKSR